jgi:hypothetical protein
MSDRIFEDFLFIEGLDSAGDPDSWGLWTGPDNITLSVISGTTGSAVSRSFVGGGTLLKVPQIVDGIGLETRPIDFEVSQVSTYVRDMVFGANIRRARVTLNRGRRSPTTHLFMADPPVRFVGRVDTADGVMGPAGGEGSIVISCRPDIIDLNVSNPAMKSDESTQELFGGDRFRRYDVAQIVARRWGGVQGTGKSKAK